MLEASLRHLIRDGSLDVAWPDGEHTHYGATATQADIAIRLTGRTTPLTLALHSDLYLGEAYIDGTLHLERGTLWDLLELLSRNVGPLSDGPLLR